MDYLLVLTNLNAGGAERFVLRLAGTLQARGHRVRFALLQHRIGLEVPKGLEVHALTRPGAAIGGGFLGKRLAAFVSAMKLRRLYRALGLGPETVTISTLTYADEVVARARLPNVWFRIANTLSEEIAAVRRRSPRAAERRLARYRKTYDGRNLIAVSDGVADDLKGPLALSRARVARIYNGFDFAGIRAASLEPAAGLPDAPFVLHVGRFVEQKRHDLLLDAYARAGLSERLVLLTNPHPQLTRMIDERGLRDRVSIAGFQANPFPWLKAAALFVLCSDREGMPNVLVEALACDTRVVSTDCPSGPREVLRGVVGGRLTPCGDADALARAMRDALGDPPPNADGLADTFSLESMAEGYEALGRAP